MNTHTLRLAAFFLLGLQASAQVTQRVSVSESGGDPYGFSLRPSISANGRFVVFNSRAFNLVPGDTGYAVDIFVRDLQLGTTEWVSVDPTGAGAWEDCGTSGISGDGRYVLFGTRSENLVPGDYNDLFDALVRDRQLGTTEVVSLAWDGSQGHEDSIPESISADGRFVTFNSWSSILVPGDTNGYTDTFLRDRQLGTTEMIDVDSAGVPGNGGGGASSVSGDGRYVAFSSGSTNLVAGDSNGISDVFIRDRQAGTTERVSISSGGVQANDGSGAPAISENGRHVAFVSGATNLVPGDSNLAGQIYVRDCLNGTTERVSVATEGTIGNGNSCYDGEPSLSADGRYVTFDSFASNLVPDDTNGVPDIFVHDRLTGTTTRVSVGSSGLQGNQMCRGSRQSISGDGRFVTFASRATNLVAGDTNVQYDVFVHDLDATGFESLCVPGSPGIAACPCANAPTGPGRGCDNSSSTGGATLSADGVAYLSMDSLTFTTSGERPNALSLLFQGDAEVASGAIAGQGVTCAGGTLRRLYVKRASGGGISVPDIFAGDLYVTEQSTALGDPIQAGESRWYVVVYRDPVVLGGCPSSSTFNATQTGKVVWSL